jgi:hypothetical protein
MGVPVDLATFHCSAGVKGCSAAGGRRAAWAVLAAANTFVSMNRRHLQPCLGHSGLQRRRSKPCSRGARAQPQRALRPLLRRVQCEIDWCRHKDALNCSEGLLARYDRRLHPRNKCAIQVVLTGQGQGLLLCFPSRLPCHETASACTAEGTVE